MKHPKNKSLKNPKQGKHQSRRSIQKHSRPGAKPEPAKAYEGPSKIVGVLSKASNGWRLQSTHPRERGEYILHAKTNFHLEEGHLAVAEVVKGRSFNAREAKLIEVLGDQNAAGAV